MPVWGLMLDNCNIQPVPNWFLLGDLADALPAPVLAGLTGGEGLGANEGCDSSGGGASESSVSIVGSVATVQLKGFMALEAPRWSRRIGTKQIGREIRSAASNDGVDEIVVEADSGGGQTGSHLPIRSALKFARELGKTVRVEVSGMLASAALRAVQDQAVSADQGSLVGSVGTRMTLVDVSGLWEGWGIKHVEVASGTLKAAWGSDKVGEELVANVKKLVDAAGRRFKGEIKASRGLEEIDAAEVARIESGELFDAEEARRLRLVDQVVEQHGKELGMDEASLKKFFKEFFETKSTGSKPSKRSAETAARELRLSARESLGGHVPAVKSRCFELAQLTTAFDVFSGHLAGEKYDGIADAVSTPGGLVELLESIDVKSGFTKALEKAMTDSKRIAGIALGNDLTSDEGGESAPAAEALGLPKQLEEHFARIGVNLEELTGKAKRHNV